MRSRLVSLPALGVVFAGSIYFAVTAARDLQPFDSSEFALNAAQLGVGHPPGQPAYLLLGAALVRALPLSPSFSLTLLSILATVAAAMLSLRLARRLAPDATNAWWAAAAAMAAFLVPGVWDFASRAEVYPLAATLLVAGTLLLFEGALVQRAAAGFLFGLAAAVNPAMAAIGLVAAAPALISVAARPSLAMAAAGVGAAIGGLLPYLALPLIGAHPHQAVVWGEPLSGASLAHYLLGSDYRAWHVSAGEYLHNLGAACAWLAGEGLLAPLALGTIGWLLPEAPLTRLRDESLLDRTRSRSFSSLPRAARLIAPLSIALSLALLALNHPFIPSNPDYAGYLLPSLWLSIAGVAALLARTVPLPRGRLLAPALLAVIAISGALSGPPLPSRNRHGSRLTRELATHVLDGAPRDAILVVESDHLVFPCIYLQEVEGRRPDLTILDAGWASSSWFWRHLAARHPELPAPPPSPERWGRIELFLEAARRPVVVESLRPLRDDRFPHLPQSRGLYSSPAFAALESAQAPPGSLDERLLAHAAVARADELWRPSSADLDAAWRVLRAAASRHLDGLRAAPPRFADDPDALARTLRARTPLTTPRALLPPEVALLRLGDLLAPYDPVGAAAYYARAALPESDLALARLLAAGQLR